MKTQEILWNTIDNHTKNMTVTQEIKAEKAFWSIVWPYYYDECPAQVIERAVEHALESANYETLN